MRNRFMRKAAIAAAASMAASTVLLGMAGPAAAAYPNQDWTQTAHNTAGARFTAAGDFFEIWDNVDDGLGARVEFNYKDIADDWTIVLRANGGHSGTNFQLREHINGKRTAIYFRVCDHSGCSNPSWQMT